MTVPPSPPLDESIVAGQPGHIADHEAIAEALNNAEPRGENELATQHGAVFNGSTDDRAAIQAAMDALGPDGGGVDLGRGTSIIGAPGLVLKDGVHLFGHGPHATKLKLKNSANSEVIITEDFAALTGGGTSGGVSQFGIHDLTVDGNRANQASAKHAVCLYGYDFELEHLRIQSAKGDGLYSEWGSSASPPLTYVSMEATLDDIKVTDCGMHGIDWHGPHDSRANALVTWENSQTTPHLYSGLATGGNGGGLVGTNCHSWGGQQGFAVYFGAGNCLFVTSVAEGAYNGQVVLAAHDCMWDGFIYAVPTTGFAVIVGQGGADAAGCTVRGKTITAATASTAGRVLDFVNSGGSNSFELENYETAAGSPITGAPGSADSILISTAGGGTSLVKTLLGNAAPTVTGSRGGNAALASLLTQLHAAGIVIDSSS